MKENKILKNPATRFLIRRGNTMKTSSKVPSHQIFDLQGLLKENKFQFTQPPDYWYAKATERKEVLNYPATRLIIR